MKCVASLGSGYSAGAYVVSLAIVSVFADTRCQVATVELLGHTTAAVPVGAIVPRAPPPEAVVAPQAESIRTRAATPVTMTARASRRDRLPAGREKTCMSTDLRGAS